MIKKTYETGRSMLEMLGVLVIIGVLTVGVLSTLQYGMTSFRAGALYTTVENVATGTADIYSWSRAYPIPGSDEGKIMGKRIKDNKICDDCESKSDGSVVITAAGGTITVKPADDAYFVIELTNVPMAVCRGLIDMQWQTAELHSPVVNKVLQCNQQSGTGYAQKITFRVH